MFKRAKLALLLSALSIGIAQASDVGDYQQEGDVSYQDKDSGYGNIQGSDTGAYFSNGSHS